MAHDHSDDDFDDNYSDRDDEDWYDDDDDLENDDSENETTAPCPDCGAPVFLISEACPACGYWITEDDRHKLWPTTDKPAWLKLTTWVLLAIFLIGILGVAGFLF